MENIFEIRFTYDQEARDIITHFSNKQGGAYNVFSYHWQCFVWAAIIGFFRDDRRAIAKAHPDKPFSLQTMRNNGGEKDAEALICLAIAKAGSLDIMKNPNDAISLINEYANGGFHYIKKLMENGASSFNDLEKVKQEIFSRIKEDIPDASIIGMESDSNAREVALADINHEEEARNEPEYVEPTIIKVRNHWTTSQIRDLKQYYKDGLSVEQLARLFEKSIEDVEKQIEKYHL